MEILETEAPIIVGWFLSSIYRCLFVLIKVPLSSAMLSNILSRLVETVAEMGDEMQGYVTEILLTLQVEMRPFLSVLSFVYLLL